MKHAYIVHLHFGRIHFNMPWLFTSEKEAYLYGEYEFRTIPELDYYEVEKLYTRMQKFYKIKG